MCLEIIILQFILPSRSLIVEASLMFQAVGFVIVFNSFNSNYSKNSNNSKNSWIWILLKNSKNSATLFRSSLNTFNIYVQNFIFVFQNLVLWQPWQQKNLSKVGFLNMSTICHLMPIKFRYQKKISLLGNIDPYQIAKWTEDKHCLAEVQHEDIVNFLLLQQSNWTEFF